MPQQYAPPVYGPLRFLYKESFHYFPEGALEVCPFLHVPRVKRESKYALIEFVEAAKAMENSAAATARCEACLNLLIAKPPHYPAH